MITLNPLDSTGLRKPMVFTILNFYGIASAAVFGALCGSLIRPFFPKGLIVFIAGASWVFSWVLRGIVQDGDSCRRQGE